MFCSTTEVKYDWEDNDFYSWGHKEDESIKYFYETKTKGYLGSKNIECVFMVQWPWYFASLYCHSKEYSVTHEFIY